jgi:hypothetical protein
MKGKGVLNILLADDDMDDCLLFKDALEELALGAALITVHDGDGLMQHPVFNKIPVIIYTTAKDEAQSYAFY